MFCYVLLLNCFVHFSLFELPFLLASANIDLVLEIPLPTRVLVVIGELTVCPGAVFDPNGNTSELEISAVLKQNYSAENVNKTNQW